MQDGDQKLREMREQLFGHKKMSSEKLKEAALVIHENLHELHEQILKPRGVRRQEYKNGRATWVAQICYDGATHHIGSYATSEAAREAYAKEAAKYKKEKPTKRKRQTHKYQRCGCALKRRKGYCSACGGENFCDCVSKTNTKTLKAQCRIHMPDKFRCLDATHHDAGMMGIPKTMCITCRPANFCLDPAHEKNFRKLKTNCRLCKPRKKESRIEKAAKIAEIVEMPIGRFAVADESKTLTSTVVMPIPTCGIHYGVCSAQLLEPALLATAMPSCSRSQYEAESSSQEDPKFMPTAPGQPIVKIEDWEMESATPGPLIDIDIEGHEDGHAVDYAFQDRWNWQRSAGRRIPQ
jgi:hypothetical protein